MTNPVVLLLSGPNLNLLGTRQPEIYGTETLEEHVSTATSVAANLGLELEHVFSNSQADLIDAVQAARGRCAGIVVNPGALTHYAWGLHDALASFDGPVIELHLSNPQTREAWRHTSVVSPVADGVIAGFGGLGYQLALEAMSRLVARR